MIMIEDMATVQDNIQEGTISNFKKGYGSVKKDTMKSYVKSGVKGAAIGITAINSSQKKTTSKD